MTIQELRQRKRALERITSIPDLLLYAEAWNVLGAEFQAMGMTANADACWQRFRHYRDLKPDEYAGLIRPVTAVTGEGQ